MHDVFFEGAVVEGIVNLESEKIEETKNCIDDSIPIHFISLNWNEGSSRALNASSCPSMLEMT